MLTLFISSLACWFGLVGAGQLWGLVKAKMKLTDDIKVRGCWLG